MTHLDGRPAGSAGRRAEIGLLVTGTRTASIVARTPMTLVAMFTREFKQSSAAVAERLRAIMRKRVARTGYQPRVRAALSVRMLLQAELP